MRRDPRPSWGVTGKPRLFRSLKAKQPEVVAELLGTVMGDVTTREAVLRTQAHALDKIRSVDIGARLDAALQLTASLQ